MVSAKGLQIGTLLQLQRVRVSKWPTHIPISYNMEMPNLPGGNNCYDAICIVKTFTDYLIMITMIFIA